MNTSVGGEEYSLYQQALRQSAKVEKRTAVTSTVENKEVVNSNKRLFKTIRLHSAQGGAVKIRAKLTNKKHWQTVAALLDARVCGEKQIEFAKKYLNKYSVNRTSFKSMVTDIGLINKENSLEVDKEKLEKELFIFIDSWSQIVQKELEYLKIKK